MVATLLVPMNVNRGGAFNDESFCNSRARALSVFQDIFGPDSDEFLEHADHLATDFNLSARPNNDTLHNYFLDAAVQAVRPQDKADMFEPKQLD